MNIGDESRPSSFKAVYFVAAILIHIVLFVSIWYIGIHEEEKDEEVVIPMELMVVVHENLDGEENELPPEVPPVSQPDPPPPDPPKDPDPPPHDEPDIADAVVLKPDKPKPPEPPKPPKPPEPLKKPDKPEKPQETLEQRLARMRDSTTKIKNPPPRNNGRTDRRPNNWKELLNAGYKPGPTNQGLDASEEGRCLTLIQQAFYKNWDRPAWTSSMGIMHLDVKFGPGGRVLGYSLKKSSGDSSADRTVLAAASRVSSVRGLSSSFLEKHKIVTVRFEVTPN
jgi:outer membrane biosynthesis protein TonB